MKVDVQWCCVDVPVKTKHLPVPVTLKIVFVFMCIDLKEKDTLISSSSYTSGRVLMLCKALFTSLPESPLCERGIRGSGENGFVGIVRMNRLKGQ